MMAAKSKPPKSIDDYISTFDAAKHRQDGFAAGDWPQVVAIGAGAIGLLLKAQSSVALPVGKRPVVR
jgi:hypothetical protein